jgi:adenylate cyclase
VRDAEQEWRKLLVGTHPALRAWRRVFRRIPSPPRCEFCAVPFAGPLAPLLKPFGKGPWSKNPRYCVGCCAKMIKHKGGAVIPLSMLFADVRGSTPLGEHLGARGLHDLMDRYYTAAIDVLFAHGAIVDRFMGDQVVGYFTPGFAGPRHAQQAILCGLEILRVTGHVGDTPWVPVGVGVHTGEAFLGAIGKGGDVVEFTALGEDVNIAARLASIAGTGELIVSDSAYATAALELPSDVKTIELKGVTEPVAIRVIHAGAASRSPG